MQASVSVPALYGGLVFGDLNGVCDLNGYCARRLGGLHGFTFPIGEILCVVAVDRHLKYVAQMLIQDDIGRNVFLRRSSFVIQRFLGFSAWQSINQ